MQHKTLFNDGTTQWIYLGRDPEKADQVIDTNQYLIIHKGKGFMMDPGGTEIFPAVLSKISEFIAVENIEGFLCSHQDPDIMSSLPLWMELAPQAKVYMSWLWEGFVAHFGYEFHDSFVAVKDEGCTIPLNGHPLQLVPAHFMHSSGNFHLYDAKAKILFSGDVGAALVPADNDIFVRDFKAHTHFMEGFHRRWMPSNDAKMDWCRRVSRLEIELLCPQHGCIFQGKNVANFISWLEDLRVGAAA